MRLHLQGQHPHIPQTELRRAVNWFSRTYLDPEYVDRLHLTVRHPKNLTVQCGDSGSFWGDPFRYVINLGKHPRPLYLRTLFHELWHVKQYLTGELSIFEQEVKWKRWSFYGENVLLRVTTPWERSAYRMENRIYDRYRRYLKKAGLTTLRKSNLIEE